MQDDLYRSRIGVSGFRQAGQNLANGGAPAFVGKVTSTGSNLGAGKFAAVTPVSILGTQTEGATASVNTRTGSQLVYQLEAFQTNDLVICRFVNYRWVAERFTMSTGGGGSGGFTPVPFCYCTEVPINLAMTSSSTTANFGMFQPCTISYQSVPSAYASLGLGSMAFLSNESFPDSLAGGATFRYLLTCGYNLWNLTRIYLDYPSFGPFEDAILYTWSVLASGNTCIPNEGGATGTPSLSLINGRPFAGSDPVTVTISG